VPKYIHKKITPFQGSKSNGYFAEYKILLNVCIPASDVSSGQSCGVMVLTSVNDIDDDIMTSELLSIKDSSGSGNGDNRSRLHQAMLLLTTKLG